MLKKYKLLFLSLIILSTSLEIASCTAIGKIVAESMTENTNGLKNVALQAFYVNNLYPNATKTTTLEYFDKGWEEGKSAVTVTFMKKVGMGFYKINGEVLLNDKPMKYLANGAYMSFLDEFENKVQNIKIKTKSGDETFINVEAPKPVRLLSVNGESENIQLDLKKDLVLEFEEFKNLEPNEKIKVSFLMDVLGAREFVDIGIFKPTKKIKIPYQAFNNLSVTASMSSVAKFNAGKNFIRVERFKVKKEKAPIVPVSQSLSMSWSTMPVSLINDSNPNEGINIKNDSKEAPFNYHFNKPNAFYGKPISKIKKLALTSLSVRGTLRNVQTSVSQSTVGNITTTTTTTTTRQFPTLPDAFWDQLLNNTYKDLVKILKENNIELIPVEKVLKSKEYEFMDNLDEENNKYKVSKTYKGLKDLMPSFGSILKQFSFTLPTDRPEIKLINELNVDGLLGLSFEVNIDPKSELIKLNPSMLIKITGGNNGYAVGPLTYMTGSISGAGAPFSEKDFSNINALNKITRKDEVMSTFKTAIKDMKNKERELGYNDIWNLQ
ncbi:MAG: hypothetical protein U0457_01610 [Candidatus Sericytochromatia bacterium]